jgi:uncharacterized protein (TIGR00725 family)
MNIGVVGGSECSQDVWDKAFELGRLIGKQGWTLICGGRTGVMESVCKGAKQEGGLTVGILPGYDYKQANRYLDVKIPTGLGYARNVLVVRASDFLIAVNGKYGTLSEISFALSEGKAVFGIDTWDIQGIKKVETPLCAIQEIKKMAGIKDE